MTLDLKNINNRIERINSFDGNLVHGSKFNQLTNRSGPGQPSSGDMVPEHAAIINDTGVSRYQRKDVNWNQVPNCLVCGNSERDAIASRLGLEFYKCCNCTHVYQDPVISQQTAAKLYQEDSSAADIYKSPLQVELDKQRFQYGLDLLDAVGAVKKGRLLDVGSGAGGFVKLAHSAGWKHVIGLDGNQNYRECYENLEGVEFIPEYFNQLSPDVLGKFDAISLWSIFEHQYQPHEFLDQLRSLLNKNGVLLVFVPNVESLATRLMRSMSPCFNWQHVSYFSPSSLLKILDEHGFQNEHLETVITEIDNIKSYMSGAHPYRGHGDPDHLFDFITPEYIHANFLGSRLIGVFRKID